jgi:hypothetical protein
MSEKLKPDEIQKLEREPRDMKSAMNEVAEEEARIRSVEQHGKASDAHENSQLITSRVRAWDALRNGSAEEIFKVDPTTNMPIERTVVDKKVARFSLLNLLHPPGRSKQTKPPPA